MHCVMVLNFQVLTLQASNLTSEDLTLTILAPASFTPPPSVLSLNSTPSSPMSPFNGYAITERLSAVAQLAESRSGAQPFFSDSQAAPVPITASSCTHLWLHSSIPLG